MGKLSILCLCVLLLVSCQEEEGNLAADDRAVVFTCVPSDIAVHTRAANDQWTAGDEVGIYMIEHDVFISSFSLPALGENVANIKYKITSDGPSSSLEPVGNPLRYPANDKSVNFVAYYPYKSNLHTTATPKDIYPVDVNDQDPLTDIDLIYHKDTTLVSYKKSAAPTVPLEFKHKLSKLKITITSSEDVDMSINPELRIGAMPTTANFSLSEGKIVDGSLGNNTGEVTAVVYSKATKEAVWEAIIIPHEEKDSYIDTNGNGRMFTFKFGTAPERSYYLKDDSKFKEGEAYEYKFQWTSNGVTLIEQNTLMDWSGTVAWSHYLTIEKTEFNLNADGGPITPNDEPVIKIRTKGIEKDDFTPPTAADNWLKPGTIEDGPEVAGGWKSYTLRFAAEENGDENTKPRKSSIFIRVKDLTLEVKVNQSRHGLYLMRESPKNENIDIPLPAGTCSFTVRTNAMDENGHHAPALKFSTTGVLKDAIAIESFPNDFWFKKTSINESHIDGDNYLYTFNFQYTTNTPPDKERELYVHVIAENDEATALRYKVTQSILTPQPRTFVADGMSNCYMVKPGGAVSFRLSRAYKFDNEKKAFTNELHTGGPYTGSFGAKIVWMDVANLIKDPVPSIGYYGPNAQLTVFANNFSGNAVVMIYKLGDTTETPVWSYHIWVTDYEPNLEGDLDTPNPDMTFKNTNNTRDIGGTNFIAMNRNLGGSTNNTATAGIGTGLFYQWGRKDPMPSTLAISEQPQPATGVITIHNVKDNERTIIYSIQNPDVFMAHSANWLTPYDNSLWGHNNDKSIYDPCPHGWRIATSGPLTYTYLDGTVPHTSWNNQKLNQNNIQHWVGENGSNNGMGTEQGRQWQAGGHSNGDDAYLFVYYTSGTYENTWHRWDLPKSQALVCRCIKEKERTT